MIKYESQIVTYLAQKVSMELTNKCIKDLQNCKIILSGDDSGLSNTWDEICVQIQGEYSMYWDTYLETIEAFIQPYLEKLNPYENFSIWLQTESGMSYDEYQNEEPIISSIDILNYIKDCILKKAGDWSNQRIRNYLESGGEIDF